MGVSNLIRIELAHINVDHPDFIGGLQAMSTIQESACQTQNQHVPAVQGTPPAPQGTQPGHQIGNTRHDSDDLSVSKQSTLRRTRWGEYAKPSSAEESLRLPSVPVVVAPPGEPSEKERINTELLKSLVSSYFAIVKRKMVDAVPKSIMHFMVNAIRESMHHECIAELYRVDLLSSLLNEADDTRQRRLQCKQKLAELTHA